MLKVVGIGQSHYADYVNSVSSPDIEIEQITKNVYTFTGIRGCESLPGTCGTRLEEPVASTSLS